VSRDATDRAEIDRAIEVFVRGFSSTKSQTHPYEYRRIDGVWVMRDTPRSRPLDYRKEEWITHGGSPSAVDALARLHTRGRFFVGAMCGLSESTAELRDVYKSLGYRLLGSEPLFLHRLKRIPRAAAAVCLERVATSALAERLGKASRSRPIPPEHLKADAPFRQYVALEAEEIVGWVRSVAAGDSQWCANMFVRPSHRRRGIATALLARMLRDDRAHGAPSSVLLASHSGALLYPKVGYEQIGTLLMLAPRRG
jgi:GNAT superfamily N-acetyltransferase